MGGVIRLIKNINAKFLQFKYEKLHQKHPLVVGPRVVASPPSLTDYKIWCFNGVPECILVINDRVGRNYLMDMYNTKWERIKNSLKQNAHYGVTDSMLPKPACLDQMLEMASTLSKPFAEVRVDFYVIKNKPVIGELTFTSGYGNYTDDFYNYLGEKIDLSKIKS